MDIKQSMLDLKQMNEQCFNQNRNILLSLQLLDQIEPKEDYQGQNQIKSIDKAPAQFETIKNEIQNQRQQQEQIKHEQKIKILDKQKQDKAEDIISYEIDNCKMIKTDQQQECIEQETQKQNNDKNDYNPLVNQEKIKQNFQVLLSKVYEIIEDIQTTNQLKDLQKSRNRDKNTHSSRVVEIALNQKNHNSSQHSKFQGFKNCNSLKTVPNIDLENHGSNVKKNAYNLPIIAHKSPRIIDISERMNTERSIRSVTLKSPSKGINLISSKKKPKGGLFISNKKQKNIQKQNLKTCTDFRISKADLTSQINNTGDNNNNNNNNTNDNNNITRSKNTKKINLSQKSNFRYSKENSQYNQQNKSVKSINNPKKVSFRLF